MSSMSAPEQQKTTSIEKQILAALASLPALPEGKSFGSVGATMDQDGIILHIKFK